MNLRIFQVDDCTWCAGYTVESVRKFHVDCIGYDNEEIYEVPIELTEKQLDEMKYWKEELDDNDPVIVSF